MLHTTLRRLRQKNACGQDCADGSYCTLVASLPAGHGDDEPITLLHILESNGIEDAVWALRATLGPAGKDVALELARRAVERALSLFEKQRPDDTNSRERVEAVRRHQLRIARARADISASEAFVDHCPTYMAACAAALAALVSVSAHIYYFTFVSYGSATAQTAVDTERQARIMDLRELLRRRGDPAESNDLG